MTKKIVLTFFALAIVAVLGYRFAIAQTPPTHWTLKINDGQAGQITNQAGTSVFASFLSNGNVGINTANPLAKLDVMGSFRLADGTQGLGKVLTSDANGFANWQIGGGGIPRVRIRSGGCYYPPEDCWGERYDVQNWYSGPRPVIAFVLRCAADEQIIGGTAMPWGSEEEAGLIIVDQTFPNRDYGYCVGASDFYPAGAVNVECRIVCAY